MRTTLLILATVVVCAAGYGVYLLFQPASLRLAARRSVPQAMNTLMSEPNEDGLNVGPGEGPWVRQFDSSGRLANAFRATRYEPQRGGMVKAADPEMVFFMKDGRRLKLKGHDGDVFVREGGAGKGKGEAAAASPLGGGGGGTRPPSRGRLNDVRIELFDVPGDAAPAMTLTMNNVAFDNDTFRIATESYTDEKGQTHAGDEVPVTIRSREGKYEFDGRGLTIRWNDRDDRLEMLEITHGERLLVNDPALLSKSAGNGQGKAKPTTAPALPQADGEVAGAVPAPEAAVVPVVAQSPAAPGAASGKVRPPQPPYRITFYDNVKIRQGDQTLVRGVNLLQVDMVLPRQSGGDAEKEKTAPAPAPATPPADAPPTTQPTEAAPTTQPATTQPAPATQPSQPPIILYWTGKLRIVPQSPEPAAAPSPAGAVASASPELPAPLAPGQGVVKMFAEAGQPVVLMRDGGEAYCSAVTYRSADGSVTLHNSSQLDEVVLRKYAAADPAMLGQPLATIHTQGVDYAPARHLATLHGRSRARLPLAVEDAKPTGADAVAVRTTAPKDNEVFDVTWTDVGNLYLLGDANAATLDRLELAGDVDVNHPQVKLQSQRLEMTFDHDPKGGTDAPAPIEQASADAAAAPTTQPATKLTPSVRHVRATEAVFCRINDSDGASRSLWCDRLDLETARLPATAAGPGRPYPQQIDAYGHVRAQDGEQQITAGLLMMTLVPADRSAGAATRPSLASSPVDTNSLELQRVVAKEAVRVNSPDGGATGDELYVTRRGENEHHVELLGAPFAEATDTKGSVIRGPRINIDPKTGRAQVVGVGSLHAMQEDANGGPARPLDVAWRGGADVDGPGNRIDVNGGVRVVTPDADGTVNVATAERVHITLAPRPTTQPANGGAGMNNAGMLPVANVRGGEMTRQPQAVAMAPNGAASRVPANAQPVPTTRPAKQPKGGTTLAAVPTDVFKDKQVATVLLEENAVVDSQLAAADGQGVLREFRLRGPQIFYDVLKDRLVVPAAGDMVVRDHSPLPPRPAQQGNVNAASDNGLGTFRGATAFRWRDRLEYDQGRRRATMVGNVEVGYRGDDVRELPVRMVADRVMADFQPKAVGAPVRPATRPTNPSGLLAGNGAKPTKLDLKLLTAYGNVRVNRATQELASERLMFDPTTGVITAFGGARSARFSESGGAQYTDADQIEWNTKTWHVRAQNIRARSR